MRSINLKILITIIVSLIFGYYLGYYRTNEQIPQQLSNIDKLNKLPIYAKENIANELIGHINWKNLNGIEARKILTQVLDASNVPNGDLAVPSEVVHSKRYVISQWQRSAVGSTVIVIGNDKNKNLYVALGAQRGSLRHPQGYMETALPQDDLTGLRAKNASRINSKTDNPVPIDKSIEENAVRELFEEIGLKIVENQLQLLSVSSDMSASPVCIAANYLVRLQDTPKLQTNDDEFPSDDLASPIWVKISDIKKNDKDQYIINSSPLPIDPKTIKILNEALAKINVKRID